MALIFEGGTGNANSGYNNSQTFSHSVGSNTNRVLFVAVVCKNASDISTITYSGISLTKIVDQPVIGDGTVGLSIWKLVAPASGANDVVLSFANYIPSYAFAFDYSGADQTTPNEANESQTDYGSTPSLSITTLTNDAVVIGVTGTRNTRTFTSGTNYTERIDANETTENRSLHVQTKPFVTAGATTHDVTISAADNFSQIAVALRPAGGGVIPNRLKQLNQTIHRSNYY